MKLETTPVAKTEMLIRRPVAEVFEAFIDPAITSRFWFTKGSGRVEPGKELQWDWEMYNLSVPVKVKEVETNKRIFVDWGTYDEMTTIEWVFTARPDNTTYVSVTNSGFTGTDDEIVKKVLDSTGGFTEVLAGLKALLEHNIELNLVRDRYPEGVWLKP